MNRPSTLRSLSSITRPHIVAIGALACLTFGHIFSGGYPWIAVGFCALDWFLVNLLNRVVDFGEDRANAVAGTEQAWRHRKLIARGGLTVLVLSLLIQGLLLPALLPWRLAYHALGLAYNWPLLPGKRRIKQLYLIKNTASTTGFILTCFAYPLAVNPSLLPDVTPLTVALVAGFFFLFELSYEIIYDLRDHAGDDAAGLPTFPVVHGVVGAQRIIDGLLVVSMVMIFGGWAAGVVPWRAAVMGTAPLIQLGLYKGMLRTGGVTSAHCTGLTWLGAALLAAYHAWELAGLPGAG
jgi:4-hydroxybenzoate polyprenyltransferase